MLVTTNDSHTCAGDVRSVTSSCYFKCILLLLYLCEYMYAGVGDGRVVNPDCAHGKLLKKGILLWGVASIFPVLLLDVGVSRCVASSC